MTKFGLYFEKLIGPIIGLITSILLIVAILKNSKNIVFIHNDGFYDKLITISSTLFGFLLAVLTLVIQGSSPTVDRMRAYGSFPRLIRFNRQAVLTSLTVCILSFVLGFCKNFFNDFNPWFFNILSVVNFGIFIWTIINTIFFVIFFYQIILTDSTIEDNSQ